MVEDVVQFLTDALWNWYQQGLYSQWAACRRRLAREYVKRILPLTQALLSAVFDEASSFFQERMGPLWSLLAAALAGLVPALGSGGHAEKGEEAGAVDHPRPCRSETFHRYDYNEGEEEVSRDDDRDDDDNNNNARGEGWAIIQRYLKSTIGDATASTGSAQTPPSVMDTSHIRRGVMEESTGLFYYSFLIRLAGEQQVFLAKIRQLLQQHEEKQQQQQQQRQKQGLALPPLAPQKPPQKPPLASSPPSSPFRDFPIPSTRQSSRPSGPQVHGSDESPLSLSLSSSPAPPPEVLERQVQAMACEAASMVVDTLWASVPLPKSPHCDDRRRGGSTGVGGGDENCPSPACAMRERLCTISLCYLTGPPTWSYHPEEEEEDEEDEENEQGNGNEDRYGPPEDGGRDGVVAMMKKVHSSDAYDYDYPLQSLSAYTTRYAGVMATLWAFTESPDPAHRLEAIRLVRALLQAMSDATASFSSSSSSMTAAGQPYARGLTQPRPVTTPPTEATTARTAGRRGIGGGGAEVQNLSASSSPTPDATRSARARLRRLALLLQHVLLEVALPAIVLLLHDPDSPAIRADAVHLLLFEGTTHLQGHLHAQEQLILMPLFSLLESNALDDPLTTLCLEQWTDQLSAMAAELRETVLLPLLPRLTARLRHEAQLPPPMPSPQQHQRGEVVPAAAPSSVVVVGGGGNGGNGGNGGESSHRHLRNDLDGAEKQMGSRASGINALEQHPAPPMPTPTPTPTPIPTPTRTGEDSVPPGDVVVAASSAAMLMMPPYWIRLAEGTCRLLLALSRTPVVNPAVLEQHLLPSMGNMVALLSQRQRLPAGLQKTLMGLISVFRQVKERTYTRHPSSHAPPSFSSSSSGVPEQRQQGEEVERRDATTRMRSMVRNGAIYPAQAAAAAAAAGGARRTTSGGDDSSSTSTKAFTISNFFQSLLS